MKNTTVRVMFYLSLLLFAVSLTQQCYCTSESCGDSLAVFLSGAACVFYGGATLSWLANPCLLMAVLFARRRPMACLAFSFLSVCQSLAFLCFKRIITDESGRYDIITSYKAGYWLWTGSHIVFLAGAIFNALVAVNGFQAHQSFNAFTINVAYSVVPASIGAALVSIP